MLDRCTWLDSPAPLPAQASQGWQVESRLLHAMDHGRVYRIGIALPPGRPPAAGWPALYALDGDWTLPLLLEQPPAPVALVAIGYGLEPAGCQAARAYDYTPPPPPDTDTADPRNPDWQNGGADAFLDFIEDVLLPRLHDSLPLDPARRTLFGHSYGGLFTLHALLCRPPLFHAYVAASPSLWWHDGWVLRQAERLARRAPPDARHLLLMAGAQEQWHEQRHGPDGTHHSRGAGHSTLPALRQLVTRLSRQDWLRSQLDVIADTSHGDMLAAATLRALGFASQLPGQASPGGRRRGKAA